MGGIVIANDADAAHFLRELRKDPEYGTGREVPK